MMLKFWRLCFLVTVFCGGVVAQAQDHFQPEHQIVFKGKLSDSYVQKDLMSDHYYTVYIFCDLDGIYSIDFKGKCFSVASYFAKAPRQMYHSHLIEPDQELEYVVFMRNTPDYYHPFIRVLTVEQGDVYGIRFDYPSGAFVNAMMPDSYEDFKFKLIMYLRENDFNFYSDSDWGSRFPDEYRPQLVDRHDRKNCRFCLSRMRR